MTPFKNLPLHSRVWIYQNIREFTSSEAELIKKRSEEFVAQWTSHDQLMKASIEIFHNRFVVICVDEKTAPASGCGIDKSVKFIQSLEKEFNTSLLDRMNVAYRKNLTPTLSKGEGGISICNVSELKNIGNITVFNNLVNTKEEFEKNWEVPLEKSWHKKFIT
ncbi:MAG: ABC transporter ATPase [Bacteroidetes bacterium]|nr:MAG: ABC transporter ATPase [Bacteroidota bacterium]